jgi:hypothetical protein
VSRNSDFYGSGASERVNCPRGRTSSGSPLPSDGGTSTRWRGAADLASRYARSIRTTDGIAVRLVQPPDERAAVAAPPVPAPAAEILQKARETLIVI